MYYDGQIITDHKAFANWTNSHGNKFYDTANGDGTYTVHEVPAPSEAEIIAQKVAELKAYLDSTDWIIDKIAEAKDYQPELVESLIEKYKPIAEKRIEARNKINELENKE